MAAGKSSAPQVDRKDDPKPPHSCRAGKWRQAFQSQSVESEFEILATWPRVPGPRRHPPPWKAPKHRLRPQRSEEHTSELQSLMRRSYAVFSLKKKKQIYE